MTHKRLISVLLVLIMLLSTVTGTLFSVSADSVTGDTPQTESSADEP